MPVVSVLGNYKWAVPDIEGNPKDCDGPFSLAQRVLYSIGIEMPAFVCDTFREHKRLEINEVFVEFGRLNRHNINGPEVWIKIAPMWDKRLSDDKEMLEKLLIAKINDLLARQFTSTRLRPSFDLDLFFTDGCGASVDASGETVVSW